MDLFLPAVDEEAVAGQEEREAPAEEAKAMVETKAGVLERLGPLGKDTTEALEQPAVMAEVPGEARKGLDKVAEWQQTALGGPEEIASFLALAFFMQLVAAGGIQVRARETLLMEVEVGVTLAER